ncbi:RNA-directed DNA polymerase, eukaryota, reverse transcriptase zinc-binding domain protein [Tanacetum coccineum]|uniref:RNA-directed DNA polymerase, eukaryota, reverse transcriptase zinc-binding domain protein n=1 Tax=Tanacetum coccineum TaxID=301880 RepID=A0ABQ4Z998_9ASTR
MYAEKSKSINFVNLSDHKAKEANKDGHGNCVNKNSKEDVSSSVCSGHFKKSGVPRTGGSILNLMDELVKVGQVMGYKMDGCMSNMTEIIESQGVKEVNFMALQETKMENMELFSVKMCWGNFAFDYVHSDSVGNSGVGGVWCLTVRDLLIIAVYAPHDCRDKQMLWDYLTYEIGKWKGEVVIMGDFNEMSKLDRFLVSENLIYSCPNINAITLERYLSDHRPILLREASFDYGPTPFRYFHYWNEMEGFNKVVEDAWREGPCDKTNAIMSWRVKVSNVEIMRGQVWDCGTSLKSPDPDGFTSGFYRRFWKIIENDVYDAVKYFFTYDNILKGCNSSFIALIPKTPDANMVKDFRPISLIGSLYKIIAKILANRLVGVLGDIVNEYFLVVYGMMRFSWEYGVNGVNVDSDKVKGAASKLGCLILKTPFTYLGSKVGGSMSRVHAWNEVIDRVKNRLSKWKMKNVVDWSSNKASWVNWKKVLASKEKGGLGVSSLFALNRGLMFKWIWRFYTQNTLLWVRVVKAIHGDDGNVGGHVKSGAKSCWLDIVRETHALKTKGINLLDCMHVKLGNGDKTVFWEDIWIDGKTLKNRFPRIYSLESCKLITVGAKLAQPSLEYSFRRNPRGGVEQDQFNELSALVHDVSLIPMSDRWKWDFESSGDFSIKVNVHAWKVKTDSLPTRFNVSRRENCSQDHPRWWDVPYVEVESYEDWFNTTNRT